MSPPWPSTFDPQLDLVLERTAAVPVERVWAAWTEPELIVRWFTPAPWKTVEAAIEVRPGGAFRTVMESPVGERYPQDGCVLFVEPGRCLVWTSVMTAGFRPAACEPGTGQLPFTARIEMEPTPDGGTRYVATVIHATGEGRRRHEAMGFGSGWGTAFDQLVALVS